MSYRFLVSVSFAFLLLIPALPAQAFWIWTPESGTWMNPKYAVKDSPKEQLAYARSFLDAGQNAEALREFRKLIKHYSKAREAADAQFDVGRVYEALGKYAAAVDAYQLVLDKYPFSELGPKAVERQYSLAIALMEGKARDGKLAETLLGTEHRVVEIFRKVIKNDPYGPFAASAQYKIALYFQARAEHQLAREEFEKTLDDYPDSEWAEPARYQIAVSDAKRSVAPQYDQQVTSAAVAGFEDFVRTNPDSGLTAEAREQIRLLSEKEAENVYVVARYYMKNRKYDSVRIYCQQILQKYAQTTWVDRARALLAEIPTEVK